MTRCPGVLGRQCPYDATLWSALPDPVCHRCAGARYEAKRDAEPLTLGPPCSPPCDDDNCTPCAVAECPTGDVLHRHGDGCPSCAPPGDEDDTEIVVTRRDGQP